MRALIHVQHLLGTGHAVRAVAIGRALAARGVAVTLASGNRLPPTLATHGLDIAPLPLARAADATFKVILDEKDQPIDEAWKAMRRDALLAVAAAVRPDLLVTETFPFGRRPFAFELRPLIERARTDRCRLVAASIRDILVRKDDPAKERWMADTALALHDLVLVHADPAFVRLEDSFPFADAIAPLVRYTGFVHAPSTVAPPPGDGVDEVIVSCGGGPVGGRLIEAALGAKALSARSGDAIWRVLVGREHGEAALAALAERAPPGLVVEAARPDFPALLGRARLSISQAGYNTVLDVIAAGCPAVFVPFAEGSETEQAQRAALIAARGRCTIVEEQAVDAASLAAACDDALERPRPVPVAVATDGAERSAEILIEEAHRRSIR